MTKIVRTFLLSLLFAAPMLAGAPARYLVFEIDRHDAVTLVASEEVELAAALESTVESFAATDDPRRVDVELRDAAGRAIFRTSVRVERWVRAEFAGADGAMEGRRIELDRAPFVVRVPAGGETLDVTAPRSRSVSQFSVRALPLTSRASTHASAVPRIKGDAGDPANRLDLLIMGDGYTASEATKFDTDVQRITSQFFGIVPYSSYRSFVNVTSFFVPSNQSGADHPNCADGGADPKEGTLVDTAFDATYCSAGLQRLLTVNGSKVYAAARAVPNWDLIMIVVNDTMYGGAGGAVSVVSTHSSAVGVAQHEFGHSFTDLADEYSTPYPGFPACSDVTGNVRCEPNVTDDLARATIKWSPWIASATVLPTPTSFTGVGLFLGARYQSNSFYRPKHNCLMNTLGQPFCEICTQAYILRLQDGWRAGASVSLIESVAPSAVTVTTNAGQSVTFNATVLHPDGGAARVRWLVDGAEVGGATTSTFIYTPTAGTHTVEVRVSDPTTLVHPAMAGSALVKSRAWTVQANAVSAGKRRRALK